MMRTEGWKEIEDRQLSEYGYQIKAQVLQGFTHRQAGFSVVLLGDSLTDYGEWSEFEWADNIQIYNRGIAGDTCRGMRNRLDSIEKLSPDCLFLMAGINNLSVAQPLHVAEREYKLLVETIVQKLPSCQKYIFSILPINNQIYKNRHIPDNTMVTQTSHMKNMSFSHNHTALSNKHYQAADFCSALRIYSGSLLTKSCAITCSCLSVAWNTVLILASITSCKIIMDCWNVTSAISFTIR